MSSSGGLQLGIAPPAYGRTSGITYNAIRNVGNFLPANVDKLRAGLARAAAGGFCHIAIAGDSASAQYEVAGNKQSPQLSFVAQLKKYLVQNGAGILDGGDGYCPAAMGLNIPTDGWVLGGSAVNNAAPNVTTTTGGTATRVSIAPCTDIWIVIHGQSAASTYQIDGGAATPITLSGLAQWDSFHIGGLADAVHTLTVNLGGVSILGGARFQRASGVVCHNLGYSGARLNSGTAGVNWSNNAAITNLPGSRLAGLPAALDLSIIQAGGNDIHNAVTPAVAAAGYPVVAAYAPLNTGNLAAVLPWHVAGDADATWSAFLAAAYTWAVGAGAHVLDWNDRVQGQATANTLGYLQSDATHPTDATSANFGKGVADLYLD